MIYYCEDSTTDTCTCKTNRHTHTHTHTLAMLSISPPEVEMVVVVEGIPEVMGLAKDTIFPTRADESLSPVCTELLVVVTSLLVAETGFFPPSVWSVVLTPSSDVVRDIVFGFGSVLAVLVVGVSLLAVRNCLTLSAAASLSLSRSSLVAVDPEERGAGCTCVCTCVCVYVCGGHK